MENIMLYWILTALLASIFSTGAFLFFRGPSESKDLKKIVTALVISCFVYAVLGKYFSLYSGNIVPIGLKIGFASLYTIGIAMTLDYLIAYLQRSGFRNFAAITLFLLVAILLFAGVIVIYGGGDIWLAVGTFGLATIFSAILYGNVGGLDSEIKPKQDH